MRLPDFGPIYTETVLGRFPVEPWNTASNIFFLLLVIFWAARTKLNHRKHLLIVTILPVLFVGFVGGTLFHATRASRLWLVMDFMPIMICSLLAAIDLWRRVIGGLYKAVFVVFFCFVSVRALIFGSDLPLTLRITIGYSSLALLLLLPAILHCFRNSGRNYHLLLATITSFSLALFCRYIDQGIGAQYFQMGTHFLWHIFGASAVYFLTDYIYRDDLVRS